MFLFDRKADPLTGQLKIQILGCQGVLTCIPQSNSAVNFGTGTDSREELTNSSSSSKATRVLKGSNKDKSRKSSETKDNDRSGL